jgi:hypothetical protein
MKLVRPPHLFSFMSNLLQNYNIFKAFLKALKKDDNKK